MNVRQKLFIVCIALSAGALSFFLIQYTQNMYEGKQRLDALTFSNTQTWGAFFLELGENAPNDFAPQLPPPPKNSSAVTKSELATLHELIKLRTEEKINEIKTEFILEDAFFGNSTIRELVDPQKRPHTHALYNTIVGYEGSVIMREKEKFNRVRPSFLDSSLVSAIEVPSHASYPSGHSTQAHLRALVFSELNPQNATVYTEDAKRIAHNREIAGVHYPSDSEAGKLLAKQLFTHLMSDENFQALFLSAKAEW